MTKNPSHSHSLDLFAIARQAMIDEGFVPDLPSSVTAEVRSVVSTTPPLPASARDLRSWLWSSIDDSKSRDLDQVEYAETLASGDTRL